MGHVGRGIGGLLLGHLYLIPHVQHLVGVAGHHATEHMGMSPHDLRVHVAAHVVDGELAGIRGNLRLQHHLKQHVAELFAHVRHVVGLDGIHGLVGLFHHVAGDALVGLLLVPGAPVRRAQRLDGGHELVEGGVLGRLHLGYQLLSHSIAPFDCGFPQHYSAPVFARSSDVFEQRLPSAFSQFLKKPEQPHSSYFVIKSPFRSLKSTHFSAKTRH